MDNNRSNGGTVKRFFMGILGGVIGGLLVMGGFYLANGSSLAPASDTSANTSSNTSSSGSTQVSNVKVNTESDVSSAVEKVQDAVVSVINLQKQQTTSDDPFGGLFGNQGTSENENNSNSSSDDSGLQEAGEGSGAIYKKSGKDAYVVTNNHVVEGSSALEVVLKDGTKLKGTLVGTDSYTDLAVIKIDGSKIDKTATFGDSSALKVGEPAIAIGSPLGSAYANSVTSGIISATARTVTDETSGINATVIQTDAAINPGNSGGPLVNIAGQVIGINSSKLASTQTSSSTIAVEGMGFAIPSNEVVTIIDQLEKDGKVTRPALGVSMVDLTEVSSQQQERILKVPSSVKTGIVVVSVQSATPAEKAGLKQYDVITEIDGKAVESKGDLQAALYKKKVGDKMEITYYRGEKKDKVTVELTIDTSALKTESNAQNNSQGD